MGAGGRGGGRDGVANIEPSGLDKGVGAKAERELAAEGDLKSLSQGEDAGIVTPATPDSSVCIVTVDLQGVKPRLCRKPDKGERDLVVAARGIDLPGALLVFQIRLLDPVGNDRAYRP